MKRVLYSLLIAICLMAVYEGAFRAVSRTYMPRAENGAVANVMTAQRYIYELREVSAVIVGSSIGKRLHGDRLPPQMYNLSFGGMSALDGINVVLTAGTNTQEVLVETNALSRGFDREFADRLFNPVLFQTRGWVVSLRDAARPLTVGLSYFQGAMRRTKRLLFGVPRSEDGGTVSYSGNGSSAAIRDQLLAYLKRENWEPLTLVEQEKLTAALSGFTDALQRRGIEITFFEMPTHPVVCESPRMASLRQMIRSSYPRQRYLRIGDCNGVQTTDGVHLAANEAARVTNQFVEAVASGKPLN
jgi:hypothetical protein